MAPALERARAVHAGDPRLEAVELLEFARLLLERYTARNAEQLAARARMLDFIDAHPGDAHRRTLAVGHLTASALVVDAASERVLLTHHRKLNRWLQLGGHCDGNANLASVALRECVEESGIGDLAILEQPIDLDIHTIPARANEPEHLHYDTRFIVLAAPNSRAIASEESHELRWFTRGELASLDTDDSVRRLVRLAFDRGAH